ncbi:histidine phosphatase family protein [Plantactinospora sp. B6F1]|uniref:histidine phosphatase family protein n=1 Tax=Plantactinospora sp. B6F1 TaxID=3158971 RepID=UPI0032D91BE5
MRWLEIRRHSLTKKGDARGRGSHLSAAGVSLARAVGAELGAFAYVLSSASPRAIETAVAMGYSVDDTVEMPSGYVEGEVAHHDQWRWQSPYEVYAELIESKGGLAQAARANLDLWIQAAASVPEGCAALVVAHGGSIEPTLVSALPEANHRGWGAPFRHCDGCRLAFRDGRFQEVTFSRAPVLG